MFHLAPNLVHHHKGILRSGNVITGDATLHGGVRVNKFGQTHPGLHEKDEKQQLIFLLEKKILNQFFSLVLYYLPNKRGAQGCANPEHFSTCILREAK